MISKAKIKNKISRIIELNCEDAGNYPSIKIFADSTAQTIVRFLIEEKILEAERVRAQKSRS